MFCTLGSACIYQTRTIPPAEGAVEGEDEEQCPVGTEKTHQHSQMEMSGGDTIVFVLLHWRKERQTKDWLNIDQPSRAVTPESMNSSWRFNRYKSGWLLKARSWRNVNSFYRCTHKHYTLSWWMNKSISSVLLRTFLPLGNKVFWRIWKGWTKLKWFSMIGYKNSLLGWQIFAIRFFFTAYLWINHNYTCASKLHISLLTVVGLER